MDGWFSQAGAGSKHLSERYAEYPAPVHDQQVYYTYEPSSSHGHVASSKHHYNGGSHKSNAAMSALTLLAFLFFLHILQQCLKEHMTAMSTPQVMVVSAGREGEHALPQTTSKRKTDKSGFVQDEKNPSKDIRLIKKIGDEDSPPNSSNYDDVFLTRITTSKQTPNENHKYKNKIVNYINKGSALEGFVSAMDEK